jgi:16S rRNA (guanine1207-N2)-methyltransferase
MSEHYYTENPVSELRFKNFTQEIKGVKLVFNAVSGVFSFDDKIDRASELLITAFYPSNEKDDGMLTPRILDVGCGFGPIGLFLKVLYPGNDLTMTDINRRAVDCANKNSEMNHLHATVVQGDLFESVGSMHFSDIVCNPPMAAGKALNLRMIDESYDRLCSGGALWLVCFHNKGGETLKKAMNARFGNSMDIVKSGGVRVYRSVK